MTYYYSKKSLSLKKTLRIVGVLLLLFGFSTLLYIFAPLISWQLYNAPAYAESALEAPIPKTVVLNPDIIKELVKNAESVVNFDSENAQSWFPNVNLKKNQPKIPSYTLSIPKIHVENAVVSTLDFDIGKHLIDYQGTAVPPDNGNAVIIGHSTLPQLFDPENYHTIFANLYQISVGDEFIVTENTIQYTYRVENIRVVDPEDTSGFAQSYDNSYLTIITCTPPGTTWKRLVIKSHLVKI